MIYALAEGLGFSIIMFVLGTMSLKKAQKGDPNPWKLYYIALAIYGFAMIGMAAGGVDAEDLVSLVVLAIVSVVYYVRISNAVKQGS